VAVALAFEPSEIVAVETAVLFAVKVTVPTAVPLEACGNGAVVTAVFSGACETEAVVTAELSCVCAVSAVA
jgi:hypothetical protein